MLKICQYIVEDISYSYFKKKMKKLKEYKKEKKINTTRDQEDKNLGLLYLYKTINLLWHLTQSKKKCKHT